MLETVNNSSFLNKKYYIKNAKYNFISSIFRLQKFLGFLVGDVTSSPTRVLRYDVLPAGFAMLEGSAAEGTVGWLLRCCMASSVRGKRAFLEVSMHNGTSSSGKATSDVTGTEGGETD